MRRRKQTSGGQALVMVTLALLAMAGIMGLAVDLGWAFFVQKEEQAAADGAALAATEEAWARLQGGVGTASVTGFTCSSTTQGTAAGQVDCETTGVWCSGGGTLVSATSNLNSGCQYVKRNGFDWTSSVQPNVYLPNINLTSNDGVYPGGSCLPPNSGDLPATTAPGVCSMSYWVTATVIQQIPQLFSSVLGNTSSNVAASATAAIAASKKPGSLFGMNQAGDCWGLPGSTTNCGLDFDNGATSGGVTAPNGVVLASDCNSSSPSSLCSQTYAANANGTVTSAVVVMGTGAPPNGGAISGNFVTSGGATITPTYSTNSSTFGDVYQGFSQPPLLGGESTSAIPSCGIPSGQKIPSGAVLGAFQYYSYTGSAANPTPDGTQIVLNGSVTTSSGAGASDCALAGGSVASWRPGATQDTNFPTYIFYGGLKNGGTTTFGPGQYVMAGDGGGNGYSLDVRGGTLTGDTATGTMIILTDNNYPGLSTQSTTVPNFSSMGNLNQGSATFKGEDVTLTGIVNRSVSGSNLPSGMNDYSGVVIWQDRRNSMVEYNDLPSLAPHCTMCTADDGTVLYCGGYSAGSCPDGVVTNAMLVTDNHVTSSSPGMILDPGNGNIALTGILYQPRGAWLQLNHGQGNGSFSGSLQVITGSFQTTSGNDSLILSGPTNPIITYKATLIH